MIRYLLDIFWEIMRVILPDFEINKLNNSRLKTALKNIDGQFIYLIIFVKIFLADFLIRQYSPNPGPLSFFSDSAKAVTSSKFALIN